MEPCSLELKQACQSSDEMENFDHYISHGETLDNIFYLSKGVLLVADGDASGYSIFCKGLEKQRA